MKCKFVVSGPPVGYTATTTRGKWNADFQKYANYAKFVRACALRAGIKLPLFASEKKPLIIKTIAYFPNRRHCDPGNVQKGICDALFYDEFGINDVPAKKRRSRKGNDKFTGGSFPPPRYDKKNPRVIVIIKSYKMKEEKNASC